MKVLSEEEKATRDKGPPLRYDNTMRTLFHSCQRKFYWWKIRGADYLVRPAYFSWGTAWHEIKGAWYSSPSHEFPPYSPEWKALAVIALQKGLKTWDDSGAQDHKFDSRINLIRLWEAYLTSHPTINWRLIKGGAELGWLWPLPSTKYFLGGSLDGYIDYPGYGKMPLEEKTTGIWLSDFYIMQWRFSSQITGYIWYLTQLLGTENVHGALINMATKQIVKGSGTTPQFAHTIETRNENDLFEFELDWKKDIKSIENCWESWHWSKTTDTINCVGGIGKSSCLYRGLCLSGLPPYFIDPLAFPNITLRKEEWEPWKRATASFLPTRSALPKHNEIFTFDKALQQTRNILWRKSN